MPYGILERPSLALGSLQASLRAANRACRTVYANLHFAHQVGLGNYNLIGSSDSKDLLGEWTFARAAFGPRCDDLEAYHEEIYFDLFAHLGLTPSSLWSALQYLRDQAEIFVDQLAQALLAAGARTVGCSSTFQQNCASLALLRRLKQLDPTLTTLMGGANCEATMGLALQRNCPWIDYVASGESDLLIVDLIRALDSPPPARLPYGILAGPVAGSPPRASVAHLNALSIPDYQDYFETLARTGLDHPIRPALALETSRGCWWGEKHHCTFCGLNGGGMGFRVKSVDRVVAEFDELSRRHGLKDFLVVDNILSMEAFKTFLPELSREGRNFRLFVETKANLKRTHIEALAEAGAFWILPGLESLHDEVLRLMDKGTTAVTNLQTLKWCRELGVRVSWSMLCGFPGERDEWYAEMAEWIPSLEHLQPPSSICPIGYHRFSPYHSRAEEFGIRQQPSPSYARVYPWESSELNDLAYFFVDAEGSCRTGQEGPGLRKVRQLLRTWALRFQSGGLPVVLSMLDRDSQLEILDTRSLASRPRHVLKGASRALYLACDSAQSRQSLQNSLQLSADQLDPILASLCREQLLFQHRDRYLALATRGDLPALPMVEDFPGGSSTVRERVV
jgi:magnesium-protoporphyrin IX monomethyl ester (oxidative) cyclase